jgi:hypothetical protein
LPDFGVDFIPQTGIYEFGYGFEDRLEGDGGVKESLSCWSLKIQEGIK